MLILAHRGYHAAVSENTLTAFEAAVTVGANGIETDVRLSRDGLPILIHDRVTPSGEAVADLTRAEIEQILDHEVPTLDEALESFPDILWNVEIKSPAALPSMVSVIKKHQARHSIIVTSFRHDLVAVCASSTRSQLWLFAGSPATNAGFSAARFQRQRQSQDQPYRMGLRNPGWCFVEAGGRERLSQFCLWSGHTSRARRLPGTWRGRGDYRLSASGANCIARVLTGC